LLCLDAEERRFGPRRQNPRSAVFLPWSFFFPSAPWLVNRVALCWCLGPPLTPSKNTFKIPSLVEECQNGCCRSPPFSKPSFLFAWARSAQYQIAPTPTFLKAISFMVKLPIRLYDWPCRIVEPPLASKVRRLVGGNLIICWGCPSSPALCSSNML